MKNIIVNKINDLITFINIHKDDFIAFNPVNYNWFEESRNIIIDNKEDTESYYSSLSEFINLGNLTVKKTFKKITEASCALDDEVLKRIDEIVVLCKSEKFFASKNANKNSSHQYDRKYDNILAHAESIIFKREEDKERQYGPFSENIAKCARIASEMCNKEITTEDFFKCMIALKIGRMAYNTKYDTLLDACGYIAGLDDYLKNKDNN